jgi:hypothetical protein
MACVPTRVAVPSLSRDSGKRLWCDRLPCGHIVGERADGTLLLCVLKNRHHGKECFHPELLPPPASLVPILEGSLNE